MTRHTGFRTILTMSVLLLVGCSGSGKAPDNTSPVITLTGDNPQVIAVGEAYVELGATASDNRDGDLTSSIAIDASTIDSAVPGTYQVTYNVRDAADNAATTVTRMVTYEDRTPPVISLVGDDPLVLPMRNVYVDPGATADDNVDGDLSASISVDASGVDTSTPGDYLVTYNLTDAAGNAATTVTRTVTIELTAPAEATVSVTGDIKTLNFSWSDPGYVDYFRLLENADGHSGFSQVGDDIPAGALTAKHVIAVHLFDWVNAQYIVEACNVMGCSSSDVVTATDVMLDTIGYIKASNTEARYYHFGRAVALSADGTTLAVGTGRLVYLFRYDGTSWAQKAYIKASNTENDDQFGLTLAISANGDTLAVGAHGEDSSATGVNGDQADNSADDSGAVYLFRFDGISWVQQAYIKASNAQARDIFGEAVALSANGRTLAVGARGEDSSATGVNGDQADDSATAAGAVYLFRFDGTSWAQQAFIKASNPDAADSFSDAVALSADGNTLAVSARYEDSLATGVNGDQADNSARFLGAGAVYLFRFDGTLWAQQAYIKASNAEDWDLFGDSVALSADGNTLAVGAGVEDGNATGINGQQDNNGRPHSGAAYLFRFDGISWAQQAYIKASNPDFNDQFGQKVALSADGNTLAVSAKDDSAATGVNGDQADNSTNIAGAVYLFRFDDMSWAQLAYIKASNTDANDQFGDAIALSANGNTLAVGAEGEDSSATGIDGDQTDNSEWWAGAVYVY